MTRREHTAQPRSRRRILVVEDQWLIAGLIEAELRELGFEVVGPAYSLDDAQKLMEQGSFAAAVLNFNLNGDTTEAIAQVLRQRGCPVLFVSAQVHENVPDELKGCTWLLKPFSHEELALALQQLAPAITEPECGDCPCLS